MISMMIFIIGIFLMMIFLDILLNIFLLNYIILLMFILLILMFNISFYEDYKLIFFDFGGDKISYLMLFLTLWIVLLMMMTILEYKFNFKFILMLMTMLIFSLSMFFFSLNMVMFYIFFEFSLIPVFIMVISSGLNKERVQAGIYMFLYTMFMSLPFFILFILMSYEFNFMNFYFMSNNLMLMKNWLFYMFLMFIFFVKLPIYFIHLWLPKAHVEAPVYGSMILAGVMLKMGGYGIIRFLNILLMLNYLNFFFIIFILIGSLNISVLCLRQIDLKMLIAYSSIVHMGLMIIGILLMSKISILSGILMMIGHGICSSGMFFLMNLNYKRINSRNLLVNKGMLNFFKNLSLWWFLFCIMNMAAPPSLNLVSEILLLAIIMKFNLLFIILLFFLSFFSGMYSIYLYSFTQHGKNYFFLKSFNFINIIEYYILILHWIPMNFMILNLYYF